MYGLNDDHFRPLYDIPAHIFRRGWQHAEAMFESKLGHLGLTSPQFVVLYAVSLAPGMEQRELAMIIHYDPVTTGGVLLRLEKRGFVRRAPSGRSRRGRAIFPTPQGIAILKQAAPLSSQQQSDLLQRLDPAEQHELMRLLSKAASVENSYNLPVRTTAPAQPVEQAPRRARVGLAE